MITLLGRPTSINVRKVLWTCTELGRALDHQPWGSGDLSLRDPAFLALNPNGMVPVIVDRRDGGEFVLWESNSICRYLAAREASALLPADARQRALVEQWMDWQVAELNKAWGYAFMALVRHSPAHGDAQQVQASIANWNRHMVLLDDQLQRTGAFVTGAAFTLADVVLGLSAWRWLSTPMARPELPAVAAWQVRLAEREGYRLHAANGVP